MSKTDLEHFVEYFSNEEHKHGVITLVYNTHPNKNKNKYFSFSYIQMLQQALYKKKFGRLTENEKCYIHYENFIKEIKQMMFYFSDKKINVERYVNFIASLEKFGNKVDTKSDLDEVKALKLFLCELKKTLLKPEMFNEVGKMSITAYLRQSNDYEKVAQVTNGISAIINLYVEIAQGFKASSTIAPRSSFHRPAVALKQSVEEGYEYFNKPASPQVT